MNIMDDEIILSDELLEKVETYLSLSSAYIFRFIAFRGVIDAKLVGIDIKDYEKTRKSLDEYGFDQNDKIALKQLDIIINRHENMNNNLDDSLEKEIDPSS
jgi:hypothetical protein